MDNILTVAIPFYNADRYLAQAIESVLSQTFEKWELILVDDGSTDQSLAVAKDYAAKDPRIKVISDGANKNLGVRLNEITGLTSTKYLARMDADDIMHPTRLEKQLLTLQKYPDIDVLGTNVITIDAQGKQTGARIDFRNKPEIIRVKVFVHPTIMAKTEWFRANKYDEKAVRIEDAELWFRTAEHSQFCILTEPLLYYREFGKYYYKKYFKGVPSLIHVLKKHRYNKISVFFAGRYVLSCIRCLFYFLIGNENKMILSRNEIIF